MKTNEMMKSFKESIESFNKEQVLALLQEKIDMLNGDAVDEEGNTITLTTDEKNQLNSECIELCKKFNQLSKLAVFGECVKAEHPVMELAKTFFYPTVSTNDELGEELDEKGVRHTFVTRTIVDNEKKLDLFEFLTWAEKLNKKVTPGAWKAPTIATRKAVEAEWRAFFNSTGETRTIKIGLIKKNLQSMFDALVYIPTPTGDKNCIVATSATARFIFGFANNCKSGRKDGEIVISKSVLSDKTWVHLVMVALHETVKDKDYAPAELMVTYGSEEDEKKSAKESKSKSNDKSENK